MSTHAQPPTDVIERVIDLQIDQAVGSITETDLRELNALLAQYPQLRTEEYEYAAAAVERAFVKDDSDAMPAQVAARVIDAIHSLSSLPTATQGGSPGLRLTDATTPQLVSHSRPRFAMLGWMAAAACLTIAAAVWFTRPAPVQPPVTQTASQKLQMFKDATPDLVQADWADWDDPEITGATGTVYWSESQQTGFMEFANLTPNDPTQEQYQLWIIDERGLETRVSGAIFNSDTAGTTIVEIEPSIAIRNAALFAITIEQPGGVWVSDMKRRVVIASLGE